MPLCLSRCMGMQYWSECVYVLPRLRQSLHVHRLLTVQMFMCASIRAKVSAFYFCCTSVLLLLHISQQCKWCLCWWHCCSTATQLYCSLQLELFSCCVQHAWGQSTRQMCNMPAIRNFRPLVHRCAEIHCNRYTCVQNISPYTILYFRASQCTDIKCRHRIY